MMARSNSTDNKNENIGLKRTLPPLKEDRSETTDDSKRNTTRTLSKRTLSPPVKSSAGPIKTYSKESNRPLRGPSPSENSLKTYFTNDTKESKGSPSKRFLFQPSKIRYWGSTFGSSQTEDSKPSVPPSIKRYLATLEEDYKESSDEWKGSIRNVDIKSLSSINKHTSTTERAKKTGWRDTSTLGEYFSDERSVLTYFSDDTRTSVYVNDTPRLQKGDRLTYQKTWTRSSEEDLSDDGHRPTICNLCCHIFPSGVSAQVHLLTHKHPPLEYMKTTRFQNEPIYTCKMCNKMISYTVCRNHKCFKDSVKELRRMIVKQIQCWGHPFTCIFCSDNNRKSFTNRFELAVHVITKHTRNVDVSNACPICKCTFKTTDSNVKEMHAIQEHVPEITMIARRIYSEEIRSTVSITHPYICIYPIDKYEGHSKVHATNYEASIVKKYCEMEFPSISQLSAHLISNHGTLIVSKKAQNKFQFFCRECTAGFPCLSSLTRHVKEHHEMAAENRAYLSTKGMPLHERFNPKLMCFTCWKTFSNEFELQAHITCAHITSQWRECDSCNREYCRLQDKVSDRLLCLQIDRHEKRHAALLKEQFKIVSDPKTQLPEKVPLCKPQPIYFTAITIYDWKKILHDKKKHVLAESVMKHFEEVGKINRNEQAELLFRDLI